MSLVILSADSAEARKRKSRKGALAIACSVSGATVSIDGKVLGKTPLEEFALISGTRRLKISKPGHVTYSRSVNIRTGKTLRLKISLKTEAADDDLGGLELEPLQSNDSDGDLDMPLEDLSPSDSGDADLDLSLEPLETIDAVSPKDGGQLPATDVGISVTPAKPWWQKWYVIAGAGAAVVATTVTVIAASSGGGSSVPDADLLWVIGEPVKGL